ncbi:hypothetical protein BaRGS_00017898 [Batillaria attramentaria]|uniref:Deoxynucleoside kinase domain-containing protein n=1 Tax=Batillaria attramentaria TaxID=370345 RepID=A0ABD0KVQ5_9CAEN
MSVTQSDSAHMICVRISQSRCHCETLTVSVSFAPTPSHTELSTLFSSDCDQNPTVSNSAQFWQPEAPPAKKQVAVEGNIGSGKTTLLEYFKSSSEVEALREPIEQWTNIQGHNALQKLYEDPSRWSFSFNMYAQLTRAQMHTKQTPKPIKLLERSLHSTRLCFVENDYRNKTINGMEYTILTNWYDWLVKSQKADVDLIVYVRADPEVCFERIQKRSRKEEALVPFSLIKDLHDLHEDWLIHHTNSKPPAPVVILDANRDYSEMKQLYETHRQDILCFLSYLLRQKKRLKYTFEDSDDEGQSQNAKLPKVNKCTQYQKVLRRHKDANSLEEFRKRERERQKKMRRNVTDEQRERIRLLQRVRQAKYRERKRMQSYYKKKRSSQEIKSSGSASRSSV